MAIDQTTVLGTSMGILIFTTLFTIGYSIYMAILNHKQAKVREEVKKTNELLESILKEIQLKILEEKK